MKKLIPKHLKGTQIKYFGTYSPKDQAYVLPIYKKEGVVLPEVTITPKNNTNLGGYMLNRDFGLGKEVASYTPAGDVMDATQIYKNTKQGNYGQAALSTGLFFLPNVIEKPLKKVGKWFGKNFFPKNSNDELDEIIKSIKLERKLKLDREFELGLLDRVLGEKSNNEYIQEIYGDRWKNAFDLALKRGYLLGYTLDDVRDALTLESRGYIGGVPFKHLNDVEMIQVNGNWGSNTPFAYATNKNGRETVYINSDKMYKNGITDDELDTGLHEVAHANTLRIEPNAANEIADAILSSVLKEQDPIRYKREKIIKDVMKYNKDISDVVDEGKVVNPRTGDLYINDIDNKDMDSYLRLIQEMRARALSINSNAKRNNISSDEIIDNANIDGNSAEMQAAQLKAASKNPKKFTKEVLGLTPLIGFYGINREDNKKYKNGGLIPKKQTAWGKLEYNGPQYSQVVELMKKEDPQAYNRLLVANARSLQPNSEVVRWTDAEGKELTSTTNIGMSSTDPIGLLYVEGVALNPVFKGLGRVAEYGLAKAGNRWARAKILSRNLDNSPKNVDKATQAFRNSEWSNFLSTRNGDNYYRMAKSNKLPDTNIEGEKLFISHTTPWEEFSGLGTSEPIGTKVLYEFPTKTFGVRKATNYRGIPGEIDVTQMGRNHLNFGNTSSGFRSKVLLLPELQAEIIGMDPYTMGVSSRPLNKKGFYDTRPDYEDIYQGNQTTVTSLELNDALLNSKYNLFEYSPSGITKKLYTPLKQKKRLIMDDKTVPVYFGKKYSVNDVVNPDGTINVRTALRILQETSKHYGVPPMLKRTENPVWHKDDPNTFLHTKKVAKNAWNLPIPPGYTKLDLMIAAVGHDFGKMVAGDGHALAGAGLLKLIFPDLTDDLFKAIYSHMNPVDEVQGNLSKYTKYADIGYKNTQPSN